MLFSPELNLPFKFSVLGFRNWCSSDVGGTAPIIFERSQKLNFDYSFRVCVSSCGGDVVRSVTDIRDIPLTI